MRFTVLGSGTSFGVPVIGCRCPVCASPDPRDQRMRVAALVEEDGRCILIDTPPEVRLQLLRAAVRSVDAVLYTHAHADHTHGIDDLRAMSVRHGDLPIYGSPQTLDILAQRFAYIFDAGAEVPDGTSRPELRPSALVAGTEVTVAGMTVLPLAFEHGPMEVYGYRIGPVAYVTDVKAVHADAIARLQGVRLLVLNALFERPHPTHLSIPEAVEVARAVGAERTLLTHLTHKWRHADLAERLPEGIEPAYDGLVATF